MAKPFHTYIFLVSVWGWTFFIRWGGIFLFLVLLFLILVLLFSLFLVLFLVSFRWWLSCFANNRFLLIKRSNKLFNWCYLCYFIFCQQLGFLLYGFALDAFNFAGLCLRLAFLANQFLTKKALGFTSRNNYAGANGAGSEKVDNNWIFLLGNLLLRILNLNLQL